MTKKRFQDSNRLIKTWRYRWYLLIPLQYAYYRIIGITIHNDNTNDSELLPPNMIWRILLGEAQIKMNWSYTTEEVLGRLKNK